LISRASWLFSWQSPLSQAAAWLSSSYYIITIITASDQHRECRQHLQASLQKDRRLQLQFILSFCNSSCVFACGTCNISVLVSLKGNSLKQIQGTHLNNFIHHKKNSSRILMYKPYHTIITNNIMRCKWSQFHKTMYIHTLVCIFYTNTSNPLF
jgi:hypothetical protein